MFDENNPIRPQDPEIRSQDPETPAETPAVPQESPAPAENPEWEEPEEIVGRLDRLLEGEFRRAAEKFSAGEPVS